MAMQVSFRNPNSDLIERMRIRYTPADIRVKSHLSRFEMKSTPSDIRIRQRAAEMEVELDHVWADLGLRKPDAVAKELSASAAREWLENAARTARDGDRLRDSAGRDADMIAKLAWERVRDARPVEVVLDALQGPRFHVTVYQPEIEVKVGTLKVDVGIEGPQIDIRLGGVDIWFIPKPLVDIVV